LHLLQNTICLISTKHQYSDQDIRPVDEHLLKLSIGQPYEIDRVDESVTTAIGGHIAVDLNREQTALFTTISHFQNFTTEAKN
jgi:hypothetical protein